MLAPSRRRRRVFDEFGSHVDAAKAVAGFCASERGPTSSVTEEIEAILQSSSGTMRDYCGGGDDADGGGVVGKASGVETASDGALERQSSYNISNLTDLSP